MWAAEHPIAAFVLLLAVLTALGQGWLAAAIALGVIVARRIGARLDARRDLLADMEEWGR